jgi:hypothetical protein
MIVVEHVQLDVGARLRPLLHRHRIHRVVSPPLEHLNRHAQRRAGAVVARRVGIELVVDRHHPAIAVMEDVEAVGALPFVEPQTAETPHPVSTEIERRRQQDQAAHARGTRQGGLHRDERAETGADQDYLVRTRVDDSQDLLDHPGDGEGGEIRLVEIGRHTLDAGVEKFPGEERGLGRACRRGKAVEVEDKRHSLVGHPGRHRHWIDPTPSVE